MHSSMGSNPWYDQERYRSWLVQQSENSGRLAQAFAVFDSTGWGEVAFDTCFDFGLFFIEPPAIGYSFEIDGDTLVDTRFPRCSGGVYKYKTNTRGFYTGAWCMVTVDTQSPYIVTTEVEPNYAISHWFTFSGIALKDLGARVIDNTGPG